MKQVPLVFTQISPLKIEIARNARKLLIRKSLGYQTYYISYEIEGEYIKILKTHTHIELDSKVPIVKENVFFSTNYISSYSGNLSEAVAELRHILRATPDRKIQEVFELLVQAGMLHILITGEH